MSNLQVQNNHSGIEVENIFNLKRVVLWGRVTVNGQQYSHSELKDYHTRQLDVFPTGKGELAVFDNDYFICMAKETVKKTFHALANGQRVIVKNTGRYGVVNHQCAGRDYYLVRLDGEISLRGFRGFELKIGDHQ